VNWAGAEPEPEPEPDADGARAHTVRVTTTVCGVLAALGLVIYLLVAGSALIQWTVLLCVWAGVLGVRIRQRIKADEDDEDDEDDARQPVWWFAVALLFPISYWLTTFARDRHWPAGQQHMLMFVADWLVRPALSAASAILLFQLFWSDGRRWLSRRRAARGAD
jgi:hypothetical protein